MNPVGHRGLTAFTFLKDLPLVHLIVISLVALCETVRGGAATVEGVLGTDWGVGAPYAPSPKSAVVMYMPLLQLELPTELTALTVNKTDEVPSVAYPLAK